MSEWKLNSFKRISEESLISDKSGQIPIRAKYEKKYLNEETGEIKINTDLDSKKYKRNKLFKMFNEKYSKYYKLSKISILSCVVNSSYSTSKFIDMIKHKLRRKNIEVLGYIWERDVGDKRFVCHQHVLVATIRIDKYLFKDLFRNKSNKYEVQFEKKPNGMKNYLINKELYGAKGQRSFGKSRKFKAP